MFDTSLQKNFGIKLSVSQSCASSLKRADNILCRTLDMMHKVTNLSYEILSLGGNIDIKVCKLTNQNIMAEFSPNDRNIRFIRSGISGYLPHEWSHALDHQIGTATLNSISTDDNYYMTENTRVKTNIEIKNIRINDIRCLMDSIMFNKCGSKSKFYRDAINMDSVEKTNYWQSPVELFARSFETYVFDRSAGIKGINQKLLSVKNIINPEQYPQGRDRKRINNAMDNYIEQIKLYEIFN